MAGGSVKNSFLLGNAWTPCIHLHNFSVIYDGSSPIYNGSMYIDIVSEMKYFLISCTMASIVIFWSEMKEWPKRPD